MTDKKLADLRKHWKSEAYEEIIRYLESRLSYKMPITAMGYECAIIEIKNLLKEKEKEDN